MYFGAENRPMGSQGFGAEKPMGKRLLVWPFYFEEGVFVVSFGPMVTEACNCLVFGQQMSKTRCQVPHPSYCVHYHCFTVGVAPT
ncbi:hypothetical protein TNCT_253831 [Trichonephila clavata]|uniref:Uncharacterized protein n=1 Tax=Trichonephila clavata TaxID=2740835 RepID=A0A8X6LW63_TRICU|nr:hypothetical protein TNCT_253831 [Trichonephila clavata]